MMPDLGKYAAEVLLAYGVSLGLIAVMVFVLLRRARNAKKTLDEIENG